MALTVDLPETDQTELPPIEGDPVVLPTPTPTPTQSPTPTPVPATAVSGKTGKTGPFGFSGAVVASVVMVIAIASVLGSTMAMMLLMTEVSVLAAFGFGLYCAFWLGIGFGVIFGGAAVFGSDH